MTKLRFLLCKILLNWSLMLMGDCETRRYMYWFFDRYCQEGETKR